jgi:hypothetical protein
MKLENLRSLIRESINEYIKEIDEAAETAAMEARIAKCDEAIQMREQKLANLESLEEVKDMVDETKVENIKKEIKELQKAKAKFEKVKEKRAAKLAGKGKKKDEVVTDAKVEEAPIDEADITAEMDLEEGSDKQTFNVDNLQSSEKHKPFKKLRREEPGANRIATSNQTDNEEDEPYNQGQTKDQPMDEGTLNESFLKMQKLAGVITENQYREKATQLNESLPIGKSELGQKIANALNVLISKMDRPDLESKARALAGQLISLADESQA